MALLRGLSALSYSAKTRRCLGLTDDLSSLSVAVGIHRQAIGLRAEPRIAALVPASMQRSRNMISYDIDPSLHCAEPEQLLLDDCFSAPRSHGDSPEPAAPSAASLEQALACKSDF